MCELCLPLPSPSLLSASAFPLVISASISLPWAPSPSALPRPARPVPPPFHSPSISDPSLQPSGCSGPSTAVSLTLPASCLPRALWLWLSPALAPRSPLARSGSLSLTTSLERLGRAPWLPHPHPRPLCLCLPPPLPHSVSPPLLRLASSLAPSVSLPSFLSVSLHRPPVPSTVSTSTRVA